MTAGIAYADEPATVEPAPATTTDTPPTEPEPPASTEPAAPPDSTPPAETPPPTETDTSPPTESGTPPAGSEPEQPGTEPAAPPAAESEPRNDPAETPVAQALGRFGGLIFKDANLNGVQDAGETGLPGVNIHISGGDPFGNLQQTTDTAGRFSFGDIPTGEYFVSYNETEPGWIVAGLFSGRNERITLDESGELADVRIRATRHLSETLQVSMTFDRDRYREGDTVRLSVILQNFATVPLIGVTATSAFDSSSALRGGAGWGPLDPGGAGLTIPASGSRFVVASEPLPAGSLEAGRVFAFIRFGAAGYAPDAGLLVDASAAVVTNVTGTGRGRIQLSTNPSMPLADLPGVTVVITDPHTGDLVAQPVTDEQGRFTVENVPTGSYDLRVAGPYEPQQFPFGGWFSLNVSVGPGFEQFFTVLPGQNEDNAPPNLTVTAEFDKPEYTSADLPRVRITVTNIGQAAAEGVHARQEFNPGSMFVDSRQFGEFAGDQPGGRIGVGETRVLEVTASFFDPRIGVVTFGVSFTPDRRDLNTGNNAANLVAPVTVTFGAYTGVLYGDEDNDGVLDPGEELPGVEVFLVGLAGPAQQTTNAQGRFFFTNVITGRYVLRASPENWNNVELEVLVTETTEDAVIRIVRALFTVLDVSMVFGDDSYQVGDTARVRVTLTNTGSTVLTPIRADCFHPGNGFDGTGAGWRPLRAEDEGVTLAPGETRTLEVTDTVPQDAATIGFVEVTCSFYRDREPFSRNPIAGDTANIAGITGTARGRLVQDPNNNGNLIAIPNTKVVLINPSTGRPVAKTVTDADGNFDIPNIPTRHYDVRVVGPWQPTAFETMRLFVTVPGGERRLILLAPGPQQPDPFPDETPATPTNPTPEAPQPQGAAAPASAGEDDELAFTGANVAGLTVLSLALLLAGFGTLLTARRRRAPV